LIDFGLSNARTCGCHIQNKSLYFEPIPIQQNLLFRPQVQLLCILLIMTHLVTYTSVF
jgi:hypothetical protein